MYLIFFMKNNSKTLITINIFFFNFLFFFTFDWVKIDSTDEIYVFSSTCDRMNTYCTHKISPRSRSCLCFSGSKVVNPFRFLEQFESWGPYVDGELIREQAVSAFLKGHWQKDKPVLLGTPSSSLKVIIKSNSPLFTGYCVCFRDHLRRRSDLCVWRLHEACLSGRMHRLHHSHLQTTRHQNPAQIPAALQRRRPQGHASTGEPCCITTQTFQHLL